jgi:uncharacterized protein YbcI
MVGLKKDFYGKGPTKAKTFLNDNYVFCVMEGGLTRNEQTLVERGHEPSYARTACGFKRQWRGRRSRAIQRITGRSVIGYHSQIVSSLTVPSRSLCWTAQCRRRAWAAAARPNRVPSSATRRCFAGRRVGRQTPQQSPRVQR